MKKGKTSLCSSALLIPSPYRLCIYCTHASVDPLLASRSENIYFSLATKFANWSLGLHLSG